MGKSTKNTKEEVSVKTPMDSDAYLKMTHEIVELPSGAIFKLRKVSRSAALEFLSLSQREEGKTTTTIKDFNDFINACVPLLKSAIVEPAFNEKFTLDDIPFIDQYALANEIIRFSGLRGEDLEKVISFR